MSDEQDPKGPVREPLKVLRFVPPPPEPREQDDPLPARAIEILESLVARARSGALKAFVLMYHLDDDGSVYGHVHAGMTSSGEILRFVGLGETKKLDLLDLLGEDRHGFDR